jgi:hypothetical protein
MVDGRLERCCLSPTPNDPSSGSYGFDHLVGPISQEKVRAYGPIGNAVMHLRRSFYLAALGYGAKSDSKLKLATRASAGRRGANGDLVLRLASQPPQRADLCDCPG